MAANPDSWYRLDVTAAIRAWMNSTASNYGLLPEPDNGPWLYHQFCSSEYAYPTLRPCLVINFRRTCSTNVNRDGIVDVVDVQTVASS
ncbi:MAG: DNRLRE domain-containing protein [Anaerolineae bacterium]